MRRILAISLLFLATVPVLADTPAPNKLSDGTDQVLAVVDGEAITYEQVLGRIDLTAEIRTQREVRRIPDTVTDAEIEQSLVYNQLVGFIIGRLLTGEAERINFHVSDSEMRGQIARERSLLGIAEGDEATWANYLQQKFAMTPSEYRERRREEIRQKNVLYLMAGAQGPVPSSYPISIYLPLSVTPKEIREQYEHDREKYKVATKIDYQSIKLVFPRNTGIDDRKKLYESFGDAQKRAKQGESLDSALSGVKTLVARTPIAGLKLVVSPRAVVDDDSKLDSTVYKMVLSVSKTGGVSELGGVVENDEAGSEYEGYMFIQLYSKKEGDARRFTDPRVQSTIGDTLRNKHLDENIAKINNELFKRAIIVPERLMPR